MENNEGCPVKGYLCKLLGASVITFAVLMLTGYIVHHVWLMPIYEATASLWRPEGEMKEMFPLMLGYYAVLSVVISALFCKARKGRMALCANAPESDCKIGGKYCPIKFGICFGALVGLLLGLQNAASFLWMPIPGGLAIKWLIAWVIQGILAGVALSLACHCCNKKGCAPK